MKWYISDAPIGAQIERATNDIQLEIVSKLHASFFDELVVLITKQLFAWKWWYFALGKISSQLVDE
jgi:hypothetical protein